jgi:hypothetical protein
VIDIADLQIKYNLSPSLAKLLLLLLNHKIVTIRMIEVENNLSTDARVAIHRLRRRLGIDGIVIQSRRDVGYWLDVATRTAITNMMDGEMMDNEPPLERGGDSDSADMEVVA